MAMLQAFIAGDRQRRQPRLGPIYREAKHTGFTLVELLIGVASGAIVLGFLGGALLTAQMRVAARMQNVVETTDSVNRSIELIRREVTYSGVLNTIFSLTSSAPLMDCEDQSTSVALIRGPITLCYKSLPLFLLPAAYQNVFQGPCVLVRVGPPYKSNGDLDTNAENTPTVMMDGLDRTGSTATNPSITECKRALQVRAGGTTESINKYRNANITLYLKNPPGTVNSSGTPLPTSTYQFSAIVPSNPAFGGFDLFAVANCTLDTGCDQQSLASAHFKVNEEVDTQTISPSVASKENILYLKYPYAEYSLQGVSGPNSFCTYTSCLITRNGKQIYTNKMDTLVFTDREIKPAS